MEFTESQQMLMNGLKALKLTKDEIVMIMMCCQEDDAADEMIDYMVQLYDNKETITMQKLLEKVVEMNQ